MKSIVGLALPALLISISGVAIGNTQNVVNDPRIDAEGPQTCLEVSDGLASPVSYHYDRSDRVNQRSIKQDAFRGQVRTVFPKQINPPGEKIFVFSPRLKQWAAYTPSGVRVGYGIANGGSNWCEELGRPCKTPVGYHRIHRKGTFECKSSRYPLPKGGAPMPYCMHFSDGYAIHGSPYISDRNSSHGCIRVKTNAANWLSKNFIGIGTKVIVMAY